jgi:sugar O-acyltransferase (sialic acid O-acetyltransferase NeuD family)
LTDTTQRLLILGTGGSAFDVLDIVEAINDTAPTWELAGFLDDARPAGSRHLGLEVLGPLRDSALFKGYMFISSIGSDKSYRRRPEILASTGLAVDRFATLVHPNASVSLRARLGHGVIVNPGVVIAGGAFIGDHVMLCPACVVGHESSIGDYSIVAPGAVISGLVVVESTCYVGARSVIRQKLRIGAQVLIGMGAVVVRDVANRATVVGNPARSIETSTPSSYPGPT